MVVGRAGNQQAEICLVLLNPVEEFDGKTFVAKDKVEVLATDADEPIRKVKNPECLQLEASLSGWYESTQSQNMLSIGHFATGSSSFCPIKPRRKLERSSSIRAMSMVSFISWKSLMILELRGR